MQAHVRKKSEARNAAGSSAPPLPEPDVHYTAFVRLPFPRGRFVDPPLVDWNISKDRALWKILSDNPRSSSLDWNELARTFQVTVPFILQQAAWLYERQLSQVREQMRRIGNPAPTIQVAGSAGEITSQPMQRLGSKDGARFQASSFRSSPLDSSTRGDISNTPALRDGPTSRGFESPNPVNAVESQAHLQDMNTNKVLMPTAEPKIVRTTSANTITQSQIDVSTPPSHQPRPISMISAHTTETKTYPAERSRIDNPSPSPPPSTSSSTLSSSSGSTSQVQNLRSQVLRRPQKFASDRSQRMRHIASSFLGEEDDDEDDAPAFLPFAVPSTQQARPYDSKPALHSPAVPASLSRTESATSETKDGFNQFNITSSASSAASSAAAISSVRAEPSVASGRRPSRPISGGNRAEQTAVASPHRRSLGLGLREGSDGTGTPSMGSSFSDLDDASVTQSALEEALASNMHRGGMSRISNFSQAHR